MFSTNSFKEIIVFLWEATRRVSAVSHDYSKIGTRTHFFLRFENCPAIFDRSPVQEVLIVSIAGFSVASILSVLNFTMFLSGSLETHRESVSDMSITRPQLSKWLRHERLPSGGDSVNANLVRERGTGVVQHQNLCWFSFWFGSTQL
jgi:hypothetical protein